MTQSTPTNSHTVNMNTLVLIEAVHRCAVRGRQFDHRCCFLSSQTHSVVKDNPHSPLQSDGIGRIWLGEFTQKCLLDFSLKIVFHFLFIILRKGPHYPGRFHLNEVCNDLFPNGGTVGLGLQHTFGGHTVQPITYTYLYTALLPEVINVSICQTTVCL